MRETPPTEQPQVTTEPQRRALDKMSNELVQRLNSMIAEQNARAQAFALQQHSLSPVPELNVPERQAANPVPAPTYIPDPIPEPEPAYTPPPLPPPLPPPAPRAANSKPRAANRNTPPPLSDAPPLPFQRKPAPKKAEKKNSSSSGCLITVGIFIFFLILRSCN